MTRRSVLVFLVLLSVAACSGGSEHGVSSLDPLAGATSAAVETTDTAVATTEVPATTAATTTVAPTTTVAVTTPPTTVAPTTVAATTVPATTAPATTAPATTVPATAAPATTVPATVAPTTAPCRVVGLNETVRRGDCGDTVRFIQDRLTVLGFPATVDGLFGLGTETAVKNFQTSRGLVADGIVGPLTWDKLVEGGIGD